MGILKTIKRVVLGGSNRAESSLKSKKIYWEGYLKEAEGKLKKVEDAKDIIEGKIRTKANSIKDLESERAKFNKGALEQYSIWEKDNSNSRALRLSKEAFEEIKRIDSEIKIAKVSMETLESNLQDVIKNERIAKKELANYSEKVKEIIEMIDLNEVRKTTVDLMKDMATDSSDFKEDKQKIEEEFHTYKAKFERVEDRNEILSSADDSEEDFAQFIKQSKEGK